MSKLTIILSGLVLSIGANAQEPTVVLAPISAVTVYEDRALVTRSCEIDLGDDVSRVMVEHLPASLDASSLRARALGAQILGVEVEVVHLEHENSEALRAAKRALQDAQRQQRLEQMRMDDARNHRDVLRSVSAAAADDASKDLRRSTGPDVNSLGSLLDFINLSSGTAREAILEAEAAWAKSKLVTDAAQRRVKELEGAGKRKEQRAVITLRTASARKAEMKLSYLIGGASWQPVYALRVQADFSGALLELGGEVSQRTGEDWTDVEMELTTARPSTGAAAPTPRPWRINLPRRYNKSVGSLSSGESAPAQDINLDGFAERRGSARLETQVIRSGQIVAFGAHRRQTLRSGARPSKVSLGQFKLKPSVTWTAFPRATQDVYVSAKMLNSTGVALPAGKTQVYVGPDYVGPLTLAACGKDEEMKVGLGVDPQVQVQREELQNENSTVGVFSKERVHARRYRITLENQRSQAIQAQILDQLPVSNDADLEVELTEFTLKQAKLGKELQENNDARGILEWHLNLQPGDEKELRFGFQVRHPSGMKLRGME